MKNYIPDLDTDSIRLLLKTLDKECREKDISAIFVVVGGAALNILLALQGREFRMTLDVDVAGLDTTDSDQLKTILDELGIELVDGLLIPGTSDMGEYLINFEDDYTNIEVFVPTYEMMVCIKSLTGRKKDYDDVMTTGILSFCDIPVTIQLIEEYKDYLLNPSPLSTYAYDILDELKKRL